MLQRTACHLSKTSDMRRVENGPHAPMDHRQSPKLELVVEVFLIFRSDQGLAVIFDIKGVLFEYKKSF